MSSSVGRSCGNIIGGNQKRQNDAHGLLCIVHPVTEAENGSGNKLASAKYLIHFARCRVTEDITQKPHHQAAQYESDNRGYDDIGDYL